MDFLEHRVPPPAVAVLGLLLGFGLRFALPQLHFALPLHGVWAALFIIAGFTISFAALRDFRRAGTTIDPTRPGAASSLVTTGVFAWTRNPMYLGLACTLFGALLLLRNGASLLAAGALIIYLDRFQIRPEERILSEKLGEPYLEYLKSVRRWL